MESYYLIKLILNIITCNNKHLLFIITLIIYYLMVSSSYLSANTFFLNIFLFNYIIKKNVRFKEKCYFSNKKKLKYK